MSQDAPSRVWLVLVTAGKMVREADLKPNVRAVNQGLDRYVAVEPVAQRSQMAITRSHWSSWTKQGYHGSLHRSIRPLRQINSRTSPDGIRVTTRRCGDGGHAFAGLPSTRRELD